MASENAVFPHPWTSLYTNGVGPELVVEHPDMLSAFRATVARAPRSPALHFFDRTTTFEELDRQSDALACWLNHSSVKPGDRVSLITQNLPAFPAMMLATWKVGAIPVPANPSYLHKELARILKDSQPSAILCEANAEAEVRLALPLAELGAVPTLVCASDQGKKQLRPGVPNSFETVLRQFAGNSPRCDSSKADGVGLILYTSGTTGQPKGAMLAHRSLVFGAQFMRDWCALRSDSRIFAVAPFFHINGSLCYLCTGFLAGCANVFHYRFDPHLAVDMIRKWRPTYTVAAITMFNALMSVPGVSHEDFASLELVHCGGAPVPPALKSKIESSLGFKIHPAYGMTESGPAVFTPSGRDAAESGGQLAVGIPIPSYHVRIVDDEGRELPPPQIGEVLMRGPQIMMGYWRKPDESTEALRDGWLHSGDIGFMDEQGWVYLVDRKKDMIIASGFKIWPREVEDVLYAHPAIREAAVIGVPDDYRGETVKACISLREGALVTEQEIVGHCRANLAGYKVPRIVEILRDLPKTVSGKIQRAALRDAT